VTIIAMPTNHKLKRKIMRFKKKFRQPVGNLDIYPIHDLDYSSNQASCSFVLRGNDPQLEMTLPHGKFKAGWYVFEMKLRTNTSHGVAKVYLLGDEGFCEDRAFPIVFSSGVRCKRVVYLEHQFDWLRFDPLENGDYLTVEELSLSRVSKSYARSFMASKISAFVPKYLGKPKAEVIASISRRHSTKEQAMQGIYREYNGVFVGQAQSISAEEDHYTNWINTAEAASSVSVRDQEKLSKEFPAQPKISIIVPVYNTDPALLRRCLDSVITQTYKNWELCVADDCSTSQETIDVLREYAAKENRIRLVMRKANGHICQASNSGLAVATGDYIGLLDHDDELAQGALFHMVSEMNERPEVKLFYSDEDKIDVTGRRQEPNFKPDWNQDLLLSQNYICHFTVMDAQLVKSVGGFRDGFEGSQDHDLLLRVTSSLSDDEIAHIPRILYHWRITENSTAMQSSAKTYTTDAGVNAVKDLLASKGVDATVVEGKLPNTYRVHYALPDAEPLVSIIIPTRDQYAILKRCIDSILEKTTYINYEILIVDNQTSCQTTLAYFAELSEFENVRVLNYDHEFNYSKINNYAVSQAKGELVALVNNDVEVISPDWLTEMASHAHRSGVGCVGAKLYYSNNLIQHAGVILGLGGVAGHSHKMRGRNDFGYVRRLLVTQNLSAVTAACLIVRKSVYEEVGGLNENDLKVAFNDVDFCLKVKSAGYRNVWTPYAELYHHESLSRGAEDTPEKIARFNAEVAYMKETWRELLENDPAYNPNLTKDREDFSIAA